MLQLKYHRLVRRRGKKRAIIAVAHTLLVIGYCVLTRGVPYHKRDEEAAKEQHQRRSIRYHTRCLAKFGVAVGPEPTPPVSPPPKPAHRRSRQLRQ